MKSRCKFAVPALMLLAAAAGCAQTNVQQQQFMTAAPMPRPHLILVYDFAVTPEEVRLDTGLSAEILQKYEAHQGFSRTAVEIKVGHKVADGLADELVNRIRGFGFWAERSFGYPHGSVKDLIIKGQLLSIDEGNRTERVAIGLGAGRTSVEAHAQIYEMTSKGVHEVEALRGEAQSGSKPGMAELMGVGSIAGHLLASTLVSGTVSGASEMTAATVEADGKRLADKIALDLGNFFVGQGWIPPDAVKQPSLFQQ